MVENAVIDYVVKKIVRYTSPEKIYLISHKVNISGDLTGFKLCIILADDSQSISETEYNLYMKIDSEIPFDLVLYKHSEWEELKDDIGSFAWKIFNTGTVVYE